MTGHTMVRAKRAPGGLGVEAKAAYIFVCDCTRIKDERAPQIHILPNVMTISKNPGQPATATPR
jgi:hypothetical protein